MKKTAKYSPQDPLPPELELIARRKKRWRNVVQLHESRPARYFEPRSRKDLVRIIQFAESRSLRVRAIGSGHSYSDVAMSNGCLVNPRYLNLIYRVNVQNLKPEVDRSRLVKVEAGVTIKKLNDCLDKDFGLALPNMGTIDAQTISGAVSTSTHGTGIGLGPICDIVRSMDLVTHGGKIYRIEPTDGITNPDTFCDPEATLIQDDDWFYSALVSMGSMGIVYAYILEAEPSFWLEETKEVTTWQQVKPLLENQTIHDGYRHVSIQINPYEVDGVRRCVVIRQKETSPVAKRTLEEATRNLLTTVLSHFKFLAVISRSLLNWFPHWTPGFTDRVIRSAKDMVYINKSYKVLHQGAARIKNMGCDAEFAFDYQENRITEAVENIFTLAEKMATEQGIYQSTFMVIRFVKGTPAYLSPQYGGDCYMIDLPVVLKAKGAFEILDTYQEAMLAMGARPHWGKVNNKLSGRLAHIRSLYPKFGKWMKMFARLNPNGSFDNRFTDRIGFSHATPNGQSEQHQDQRTPSGHKN